MTGPVVTQHTPAASVSQSMAAGVGVWEVSNPCQARDAAEKHDEGVGS
jgi:hypothetical protein